MFISARALHDLTIIGKSDPMCIVSEFNKKTKEWKQVARTKPVKNDMNPDFAAVEMKYWFEKRQQLKFEVFDSDKDEPTKSMGLIETTMSKIMAAKSQILEMKM